MLLHAAGFHQPRTHERRIPHDPDLIARRQDFFPVHPERVALVDVGVGRERQEVHFAVDDALGLLHHLAFGDPYRCLGDGDGEVVDLDAVELLDADLDGGVGRFVEAEDAAAGLVEDGLAQDVVLEAAQGEIALREEIPTAARRIELDATSDTM